MILENTDGEWGSESGKRREASAGYVYLEVTAVGNWPLGISGGFHGTLLRAVPRSGQGSIDIYLSTASYDGLRATPRGIASWLFWHTAHRPREIPQDERHE